MINNNNNNNKINPNKTKQVHYLSGPIAVPTAQPGDLLKVDFLNLGCLDGDEWGFTGTFAKENGGGFLTDHYPKATKVRPWDVFVYLNIMECVYSIFIFDLRQSGTLKVFTHKVVIFPV